MPKTFATRPISPELVILHDGTALDVLRYVYDRAGLVEVHTQDGQTIPQEQVLDVEPKNPAPEPADEPPGHSCVFGPAGPCAGCAYDVQEA